MKKPLLWLTVVSSIVVVVAGCSTTPHKPATVVDKSTYAQPSSAQKALIDAEAQRRASLASGKTYTVQRGDTLYSIALRHGLSVDELKQLNNISDPTQLRVGQQLALTNTVRQAYDDTPSDVRVTPIAVPSAETPATARTETVTSDVLNARDKATTAAQNAKTQTQQATQNAAAAATAATASAVAAAKSQASSATSSTTSSSRMSWPVKGKVVSDYKANGKGLDIAGNKGDAVVAAADGEVLFVGVVKGYGNLVIVKHSPTLVTAYGNNDRITVASGTRVRAGQKIAEMGTDGGQSALRFEVREKGRPIDPMQFLPR